LLDTAYANEVCVIPESRIYLPSAFSPNGDGINDVFKPSAIFIYNQSAESLYNYQMEIFDRWGNKQFESANLHEGWDGVANGRKAPAGVYLYKVKAVGLDGEIFDFKGTLHLIR
jgi:gliding motility-associated-like protein